MAALTIANRCGVPGTFGAVARTLHGGQAVVLSTWHVLFGRGSGEGGEVWVVDRSRGWRQRSRVGTALYGKIGMVRFDGEMYYVDCAVASCGDVPEGLSRVAAHGVARPGDRVTKSGAVTRTTSGVVVSANHFDVAQLDGRAYPAPRQLLVRTVDGSAPFCAEGDSGALLINEMGRAVGLLWGTNSRGEGVACPIGPVLYAMNITLAAEP